MAKTVVVKVDTTQKNDPKPTKEGGTNDEKTKLSPKVLGKKAGKGSKKPNYKSLASFLNRLVKLITPKHGISNDSMKIMDNLLQDTIELLAAYACNIARLNNRKTLSTSDIQASVKLVFGYKMGQKALSTLKVAVEAYKHSIKDDSYDPESDGDGMSMKTIRKTESKPKEPQQKQKSKHK